MSTCSRFRSFLIVACTLGSLALPLSITAADEPAGVSVGSLPIPADLNEEDVRDVVAYSLAARTWTVKEKKGNRVVGHLVHRGYDATITFVIEGENLQIYCDGYAVDKHGNRKKPKLPEGWIENLKKDIPKRLAMTAATR